MSAKRLRSALGLTLSLGLLVGTAAVSLAAEGVTPDPTTHPTAPPSGSTNLGSAVSLFGDPVSGAQIFAANCVSCHGTAGDDTATWTNPTANPTTQNYPGLNDVQNPNGNYAIDPTIFDVNPAVFVRNLDAFIQNGSRPNYNNAGATPDQQAVPTMPDWGASGKLTQQQVADVAAYIMSLSHVKWPTLTASAGNRVLNVSGSDFAAGSQVALSLNGQSLGTITVSGTPGVSGGQIQYGTFSASFPLPSGTNAGKLTASYAELNVPGIFPGGQAANMSGVSPASETNSEGLGMDAASGADYPVAVASFSVSAPPPSTAPTTQTGSSGKTASTPVSTTPANSGTTGTSTPTSGNTTSSNQLPKSVSVKKIPSTGAAGIWETGVGALVALLGLGLRRRRNHA